MSNEETEHELALQQGKMYYKWEIWEWSGIEGGHILLRAGSCSLQEINMMWESSMCSIGVGSYLYGKYRITLDSFDEDVRQCQNNPDLLSEKSFFSNKAYAFKMMGAYSKAMELQNGPQASQAESIALKDCTEQYRQHLLCSRIMSSDWVPCSIITDLKKSKPSGSDDLPAQHWRRTSMCAKLCRSLDSLQWGTGHSKEIGERRLEAIIAEKKSLYPRFDSAYLNSFQIKKFVVLVLSSMSLNGGIFNASCTLFPQTWRHGIFSLLSKRKRGDSGYPRGSWNVFVRGSL